MTDQELIQLLQEKPPSEFSVEEFEALRTRWTQSPELRQALIEHLHLESQLSGAFGQVDLKIDSILKRAKEVRRHTPNGRSRLWLWSAGLMVLVAVGLGFTFWSNRHQPQRMDLAQQPNEEFNSSEPVAISPEQSLGQPADALDAMVTAGIKPADPISEPKTTAVTPAKVEPEPVPDEPWTKSLARDVAPWPANSPRLTRDFKGAGHDELPELEARRWFTKIDGQPFNWGQDAYGQQQRRIARFHGFARLRAPWPKDALLRMTPFDVTDLTIYLWHGPNGLALRLYTRREPHLWAAFEVVRESSSPKPVKWGLLTTDNCGYARGGAASPQGGAGTFEIQYQDGGVTLARGGVPVMSAPLSGVPSEVFVEGQFRLRGISIHRSAPLPLIPENPHPLILGGAAAGLPWAASAEAPAELIEGPNQSADFKVDSRDKPGTFTVPIGQRGLYEVIARVDAADPGTGIFLGDLDGRPLHRVGFFKDSATGRTTIGVLRPGEHRDQANFDFNAYPPPYQTPSQWIKVVAGVGTVQILVSGDGRHWGHLLENPARDLTGAVATVGIFGLPGPAARSLKLAQLEVRSLSGLSQLANSKLIAQVPVFNGEETKDLVRWTHRMMDTQPVGIELSDWANAFALATLTRGPQRDLGVIVLKRLVAASIRSPIPVSQKLLILDEASLLCDLWDEGAARALADQYEIIAEQISAGGDHHPLATIRPAVLRSTMWSSSRLRFAWERESSRELMRAAYGADWTDAFRTGQTEAFWNSAPHPDWIPGDRTSEIIARQSRWVRAISIENAPQLEDGQSGVLPQAWRHPLALQWNKEAYNVRAELQSALTGLTYEDACRIVMSINVSDGPGLLPDMDDRQLFVSLPTAVASAMQLHPEFARLMAEKFGPLGVIRVRQAIQSGDIRGVQAATLQFFGTEAAAEAHQWLGDRDLSAGSFPSAEEHFLLGLAHCLPRQRDGLQSRLNLAMALNGKPLPDSTGPMSAIELNGVAITAGELDSLVKSLAARPSTARRFLHAPIVAPEVLPPRSYKAESRASFDGQPGLNPGRNEFQSGDPFGKQIAFVADEQRGRAWYRTPHSASNTKPHQPRKRRGKKLMCYRS